MARLTYQRGLRLKSRTQATAEAENPWQDDRTTAQYQQAARRSLPPTAAGLVSQPSAAAPAPTSIEQRASAAVERFWDEQSRTRRTEIMARAFDPAWVRALIALVGIALGVVFGWVLVAGPELPSFTTKTKMLVPELARAAAPEAPAPLPPVAASAQPLQPDAESGNSPAADKAPRKTAKKSASKKQQVASTPSPTGRPATLRINSRPWSEVFIDDKSVGSTPQLSISLQPGVHNVRLHNRQLNLLKILTLHVLPGETIDRVELLDP